MGTSKSGSKRDRLAPTEVDRTVKIPRITPQTPTKSQYQCVCCGKIYKRQKGNFYASKSPLYESNNGYSPYCRNCIDTYYNDLVAFFKGNDIQALRRLCQILDLYYNDNIADIALKSTGNSSYISAYCAKSQLQQNTKKGSTYLDTIVQEVARNTGAGLEELEQDAQEEPVSEETITRWGDGFAVSEYRALDAHYKTLKQKTDPDDVVQDSHVIAACIAKILSDRARRTGDLDTWDKLQKSYQSSLKAANLKTMTMSAEQQSENDQTWGQFIKKVEQYTPAEIYQDKKLYADFDGLKSYFQRFVLRPMRNFFGGTRDKDKEFSIPVDGDGDV